MSHIAYVDDLARHVLNRACTLRWHGIRKDEALRPSSLTCTCPHCSSHWSQVLVTSDFNTGTLSEVTIAINNGISRLTFYLLQCKENCFRKQESMYKVLTPNIKPPI